MARALCCVFILFIVSAVVCAKEHSSHKQFDKPAQEVSEAAERAAVWMGAEIRKRDAGTRTLVFSSSQSLGMEQYSGYHATFVAEEQLSANDGYATGEWDSVVSFGRRVGCRFRCCLAVFQSAETRVGIMRLV